VIVKLAALGNAMAVLAVLIAPAAYAVPPDPLQSYFVPQSGPVTTPTEGAAAIAFAIRCPDNDGAQVLKNASRLMVVARASDGSPIPGIAASDICVLFNGGTAAQGFVGGIGADSVIANSAYNFTPLCPDLRCVTADAATNANGETYITFAGADPLVPGVTLRNSNRKWGHYDFELPVYVLGFKLSGKLTSGSAIGTYLLRIKNFDSTGGLLGSHPSDDNVGEWVDPGDFNVIANGIGSSNVFSYWRDFDSDGDVGPSDFNIITAHATHNCDTPTP